MTHSHSHTHFGDVADVPLAVEQNGDDPQAGRVAEGAEQVSQVRGCLIFEQHII